LYDVNTLPPDETTLGGVAYQDGSRKPDKKNQSGQQGEPYDNDHTINNPSILDDVRQGLSNFVMAGIIINN
jgi:hypothetical protein